MKDPNIAVVTSLTVAASIFWIVLRTILLRRIKFKKPFKDLPTPPDPHWLFGHLSLLRSFQNPRKGPKALLDHCNEYGQIGIWIGFKPVLFVTQAEDARTILNHEYIRQTPKILSKHATMFLGKNNIGQLQGQEWRLHRRAIHQSMTPSVLAESRQTMVDAVHTLVESIKNRMKETSSSLLEIDVEPLMKMITIDIFGMTALNIDLGCCKNLKPSPIANAFEFLLEELTKRIFEDPLSIPNRLYSLPTVRNRRHKQQRTLLRNFLSARIQDKKEKNDTKDNDLLSNLLAAHGNIDNTGRTSEQTLNDTLLALLFAGYDTTSITLTYALYLLARNPNVAKLCLEEITSLPLHAPVKELVYCRAVLYETLRLYPPG